MPIRFRCPHCSRLLGIARRKAGSQIQCPQCARSVAVPGDDAGGGEPDDLDDLLNPFSPPAAPPAPLAAPPVPAPEPAWPAVAATRPLVPRAPVPVVADAPPAPKPPPAARPQPKHYAAEDAPLFEQGDVDAILGVKKAGGVLNLDDEPEPGPKPVSGMDAMSLDDGPRKIVLSPQRATLLVVAVVVLLGAAFAAGFLIASHL